MKTKEQQKFERWAMPIIEVAAKVLLLEHFFPVRIQYKKPVDMASTDTYMQCGFSFPYQTIKISYSDEALKDFKEKDFEQLTFSLVHEMCHPLTDPLYDKAVSRYVTKDEVNAEREKLTDHIANVVLKSKLIK
jgi:hypothetical protein